LILLVDDVVIELFVSVHSLFSLIIQLGVGLLI
jgi:hypothetical protein